MSKAREGLTLVDHGDECRPPGKAAKGLADNAVLVVDGCGHAWRLSRHDDHTSWWREPRLDQEPTP